MCEYLFPDQNYNWKKNKSDGIRQWTFDESVENVWKNLKVSGGKKKCEKKEERDITVDRNGSSLLTLVNQREKVSQ